jgi:uncharacterized protein (TIGR02145 family)
MSVAMITKPFYLAILFSFFLISTTGQVGIGTQSPDSTAILDIKADNKGLLVPRLITAAQLGIKNPALGLLVFNTDFLKFYYFDGNQWLGMSGSISDTLDIWRCGDSLYYSGQYYHTLQIGTQCWFQESLNAGTMLFNPAEAIDNSVIEKYCYEDDASNCQVYGGLYPWQEMMQYDNSERARGVCPFGWVIPSDADWVALINFLGGETVAGGKLKEEGLSHWLSPNTGATNESGFTGLPGGFRNYDGHYGNLGILGNFWSSTINFTGYPWYIYLNRSLESSGRTYTNYQQGFSVRCLNGTVYQPPATPSDPGPANGAEYQFLDIDLSWHCSDPENSPLLFDIYFDTLNPPGLVESSVQLYSFDPGTLLYGKTYYWKIVATDPGMLSTEGPVWNFSTLLIPGSPCPGTSTVEYGGKTYNTVQIGTQCWLKENLDIGTWIPDSQGQSDNDIIEKYCFNNIEDSCAVYGGLYQWNEMKQYYAAEGVQGICPDGWLLPTEADWMTLISFLGGESIAGGKMKESGTNHWITPNTGASNESGFTCLPGGWRNFSVFDGINSWGFFWSIRKNVGSAWFYFLRYDQENIIRSYTAESLGLSVRCIRNETEP